MAKHVVRLTEEERKKLSDLISKGRGAAASLQDPLTHPEHSLEYNPKKMSPSWS